MPINILMPALSPTMEKGNLAKWLKKEGDKVKAGDVIAEIETDKATMEIEAVDDGTISRILVPEGSEGVKVNTPIAVLSGDGDATAPAPSAKPDAKPQPAQSPPPEAKLASGAPGSVAERNPETGKETVAARPEANAVPAQPKTHAAADP